MKKLLFTTLFLSCLAAAQAQSMKKDTAIIHRVHGVPAFVMCEPTAEYEVTGNVNDEDAASIINAIGGTQTYRTIKESCEVIIDNATRKQRKGKLKFDAVIISDDGHNGTCIKFK